MTVAMLSVCRLVRGNGSSGAVSRPARFGMFNEADLMNPYCTTLVKNLTAPVQPGGVVPGDNE
jgi:hypothetical protein